MAKKESMAEFQAERTRLNDVVMKYAGLTTKRFFSLDGQAYRESDGLPVKYKELMGLVASLVLRCDDCIKYHINRSFEEGVTDQELDEAMSIGLIVGGSIVIPHLRRAWDAWNDLKSQG